MNHNIPSSITFHNRRHLRADLGLLFVSIIWGSAFVVQRIAAPSTSFFLFNGLRFLLGALALIPIAWITALKAHTKLQINRHDLVGIAIAGWLLTAGAALQQAGLRYTTAGNAGFITGLYVVLIPLFQVLFLKRTSRPITWVAVLLAAVGLFLLSTGGNLSIRRGDALELAGAVFWALHLIWIGHIVHRINMLILAVGQYLTCGVVSCLAGLILEPNNTSAIPTAIWAILYTGILSVGVGYTLQAACQKTAPPADAAIILSAEAVFAAWFGWLFLDEALTLLQFLGCLVMLSGMLLAQADNFQKRIGESNA